MKIYNEFSHIKGLKEFLNLNRNGIYRVTEVYWQSTF